MVKDDRFDYFGFAGQTAEQLRAKGYIVWLPPRPKGEFLGEGDTFTYLNLLNNGLFGYRDATPGGWAGRGRVSIAFDSTGGGALRPQAGTRPPSPNPNFVPAAQNDFAARMKWTVTPTFGGANHEPVVSLRGPSQITARAGEPVRIEVVTSDPDGDAVRVRWWRWKDVDSYPGQVTIASPGSLATSVVVPNDASAGQTIQLVLEATDDGTPALTRYQRVTISVVR
jgi:hypothetical protein